MALPVALFAMIASMGLASAAVMVSVDVQQGSKRDTSAKGAIAAADAGANVARLRLNRYSTVLGPTTPCIVVNGAGMLEGTALLATDGWCPQVTGTVGGATYAYRVSPVGIGCGTYDLCVVATGTADGVSRRIEVSYESLQPEGSGSSTKDETAQEKTEREERELKEKEEAEDIAGATWSTGIGIDGVIGLDKVTIDNNADARVNVGTNGEVEVFNNGNICGHIRYGVGKKEPYFHNNGKWCAGYTKTQANVDLPPVSSFMPADIATNNSNFRLALCTQTKPIKVPTGCQTDTYSGSWKSTIPWNVSTRTIETSNNSTLTLGGGDYFACKLILSNNSHLIMADGAQVRVFFDTPENCGLAPGTKQIDVSNNANITATGYQPSLGQYDLPGFYLTGSPTIPTTVEWSNNSGTNEFVLYAPNSNIELKNNATYYGIIAGKTVHLNNNAVVIQNAGFTLPSILNPWKETISGGGGTEEEKIKKEQEEKELKEKEDLEGDPAPAAIFFSPKAYVECSSLPAAGESPNASC